uniref:Transcription elongation regulator 1-like isoform X1 n=1 Tax=Geotrypetes seraphini TaxID=260995 RepID=A0A6P8RJS5_GEOSA|nr:transcription elongation regulator 1-like isoform X1 [Geotrypetes seraphini]
MQPETHEITQKQSMAVRRNPNFGTEDSRLLEHHFFKTEDRSRTYLQYRTSWHRLTKRFNHLAFFPRDILIHSQMCCRKAARYLQPQLTSAEAAAARAPPEGPEAGHEEAEAAARAEAQDMARERAEAEAQDMAWERAEAEAEAQNMAWERAEAEARERAQDMAQAEAQEMAEESAEAQWPAQNPSPKIPTPYPKLSYPSGSRPHPTLSPPRAA